MRRPGGQRHSVAPRVPPDASPTRGSGAPNSEPLPRAAPAAGRRTRSPPTPLPRSARPRGGHPAPAEKLTCGRHGAAAAAAARASLTRPPAARPPSRPASAGRERRTGAAAAAERVRTCSVPPPPPPSGTYHRGGVGGGRGARRNRGQSWMLPRGRAKNRRRSEEQLELKGAAAASLPPAPGGRRLPGAGVTCRRAGPPRGGREEALTPGQFLRCPCPCPCPGAARAFAVGALRHARRLVLPRKRAALPLLGAAPRGSWSA